MFYPEESLKKGGRFYLCWVADSWPLCFATISHRQLWSQDIRKICDDLLKVMNNESGRPASRFSLRLSSQLMRGLVRLYQRKVIIMLGDLCMINARVMKSSNKKFNILEPVEEVERQLFPVLELPAVQEPVPANEERVEEMLQQSGNIVGNIQDITLKEAAIPDFLLPPNDGFGEENPNQAVQLLPDRTMELMLGASTSAVHSGLDLPQDKSSAQDIVCESHLVVEPQMERISEHDITMFRKSTAQDILPMEFEKDIPIPEIPPPEVIAPVEKEPVVPEPEIAPVPVPVEEPEPEPVVVAERERPAQAHEEIELEELGELEPQVKRRRKHKLIVDKKTILPSSFLRPRLENIAVELRCEDSSEDIVDLRVPCDILFGRPAAAGARFHSTLARPLTRLFSKNLGFFGSGPLGQREMELALASGRQAVAPTLDIIPEEPQPIPEPQAIEPIVHEEAPILDQSVAVPGLRVSGTDIADLPTQKLDLSHKPVTPEKRPDTPEKRPETPEKRPASPEKRTEAQEKRRETVLQKKESLPQKKSASVAQKRQSSQDNAEAPKRQRLSGFQSYSQLRDSQREQDIVEKENIPDNRQTMPPAEIIDEQLLIPEIEIQPESDPEKRLTSMLQAAGLADMEMRPVVQQEDECQRKSRRNGSESSETMLGSLDRTKVSLGDSEQTTDSKRFIRDQWGTEGTMVKIMWAIKAEVPSISVEALVSRGPVLPRCRRVIAARCFSSILKLKQHGFIKVHKNPETLEVTDILLGPKLDNFVYS